MIRENSMKSARFLWRLLTGPAIPFYTLPYLMGLLIAGTIAHKSIGSYAAQSLFFESWFLHTGMIPIPGVRTVLTLLFAGLLARTVSTFLTFPSPGPSAQTLNMKTLGAHLCHLGILVLLLGGILSSSVSVDGILTLKNGQKSHIYVDNEHGQETRTWQLPFEVELTAFTIQTYPGSRKARNYISDIKLYAEGKTFPAQISMNRPLRYNGYSIYQSGFTDAESSTASILTVVRNPASPLPYISGILIVCGLVLHLLSRRNGRKTEKGMPQ